MEFEVAELVRHNSAALLGTAMRKYDLVMQYAKLLRKGDVAPPIIVSTDGRRVLNGLCRVCAAVHVGRQFITGTQPTVGGERGYSLQ